eukprot:COSAG02_NODE_1198_length_13931_cov_66.449754_11_plen_114_part_00
MKILLLLWILGEFRCLFWFHFVPQKREFQGTHPAHAMECLRKANFSSDRGPKTSSAPRNCENDAYLHRAGSTGMHALTLSSPGSPFVENRTPVPYVLTTMILDSTYRIYGYRT